MDSLIYHSLTVLNGINVLRGELLHTGVPYLLSWLFFNKFNIVVVGLVQFLSYLQPSLYFKEFLGLLIIPAFWGVYIFINNPPKKAVLFLLFLIICLIPGAFYYPTRIIQLIWVGWLIWGTFIVIGIRAFFRR